MILKRQINNKKVALVPGEGGSGAFGHASGCQTCPSLQEGLERGLQQVLGSFYVPPFAL